MTEGYRKIFEHNLPWYKKYWNRCDFVFKGSMFIILSLLVITSPTILQGIKNSNARYVKNRWILENVRDISDDTFAKLDEEKPPEEYRKFRKN